MGGNAVFESHAFSFHILFSDIPGEIRKDANGNEMQVQHKIVTNSFGQNIVTNAQMFKVDPVQLYVCGVCLCACGIFAVSACL